MTLLEETYTGIYRTYLSQDLAASMLADYEAVWPPATVPRLVPSDETTDQAPSIAIYATEEPGKHPLLAQVTIYIQIKIRTRYVPEGETDPSGDDTATAKQWLTALEIALKDDAALQAFIIALPDEQKTGGNTLVRQFDNSIRHEVNAADHLQIWEIRITHQVDLSPED